MKRTALRTCPAYLLALLAIVSWHAPQARAAECSELANLKLPHVEVTRAETVAAGAFTPPASAGPQLGAPPNAYARLPAFCRIAGTLRPTPDSDIRFEVWMPASNWNGKFVGTGNGVWAGSITYQSMAAPLSLGYATAATDDGHQGSPLDAGFAAGHPEKLVDFGYRAVHETTVTAKALIAAFYGSALNRSLFVSCSTGGRQGLMEAYRYPDDYQGISAMAPANPMVGLMVSSLWSGYVTLKDRASYIPRSKFAMIHQAVLKACDGADGVTDGIVSSPQMCHFDPASLQCRSSDGPDCLTAAQVTALRAVYQGPRDPRTGRSIFAGFEPGSEGQLPVVTNGPKPFGAATTFMGDLVFKDPNWNFRNFDYDKDVERARQAGSAQLDVPASGPDRFLAGGRKLLLSHGWADGLIPPLNTVEFYDQLTRHLDGRQAQNVRLFMIPGMAHCGGGDGPFLFDAITTLDHWVASGRAPDRIVVSNPPGAPSRTRPLCPYPQVAAYVGQGSTDEAKNFRCAMPSR